MASLAWHNRTPARCQKEAAWTRNIRTNCPPNAKAAAVWSVCKHLEALPYYITLHHIEIDIILHHITLCSILFDHILSSLTYFLVPMKSWKTGRQVTWCFQQNRRAPTELPRLLCFRSPHNLLLLVLALLEGAEQQNQHLNRLNTIAPLLHWRKQLVHEPKVLNPELSTRPKNRNRKSVDCTLWFLQNRTCTLPSESRLRGNCPSTNDRNDPRSELASPNQTTHLSGPVVGCI